MLNAKQVNKGKQLIVKKNEINVKWSKEADNYGETSTQILKKIGFTLFKAEKHLRDKGLLT